MSSNNLQREVPNCGFQPEIPTGIYHRPAVYLAQSIFPASASVLSNRHTDNQSDAAPATHGPSLPRIIRWHGDLSPHTRNRYGFSHRPLQHEVVIDFGTPHVPPPHALTTTLFLGQSLTYRTTHYRPNFLPSRQSDGSSPKARIFQVPR